METSRGTHFAAHCGNNAIPRLPKGSIHTSVTVGIIIGTGPWRPLIVKASRLRRYSRPYQLRNDHGESIETY